MSFYFLILISICYVIYDCMFLIMGYEGKAGLLAVLAYFVMEVNIPKAFVKPMQAREFRQFRV
jgi:hypothetical protein